MSRRPNSTIAVSSRDTRGPVDAGRHFELLKYFSALRINAPHLALVTFPGAVPELALDPSDPRDKPVGVDCAQDRPGFRIDLMDFARHRKPKKEPESINQIIERSLTLVQKQKSFNTIETVLELDSNLPVALVDAGQIQQIFLNLFINAVEAMPDGGTLTVTSRVSGSPGMLEITVSDTGTGIRESDLKKIFEPFFSTKGTKGNGLGLAAVWGIMENHQGTISVDSTLGKGTVFHLLLPIGEKIEPEPGSR